MALDSEQKFEILRHLGYPAKTIVVGSTHFNSIISDRLNNLPLEVEDIIAELLADMDAVRGKLLTAQDIVKVKRVGDIELNTGEISSLKGEYRRLSRELGDLLDIPLRRGGGMNAAVCL